MSERTCVIDGCDSPIRARGWCATHYSQWRRKGNPLWRDEKPESICTLSDCDRKIYGRGLCQMHYQRVRSTGSTDPRPARQVGTCKVVECNRLLTPPHGRGMCGRHYQKWQKYGDPLGQRSLKVGVAPCSIEGCNLLVASRDWCSKHYTRWSRYGDPVARMPGEVVEGKRICPTCREDKTLVDEWGEGQGECRRCAAARAAAYRERNPYTPVAGSPRQCDCCGQVFLANKRRSRYCSRECFQAYKNRANWKHMVARRARLRDAFVEFFDRREIFERDGWVCQICLEPVDQAARFPDPTSPSLDHIIPLARGGEHSRANAQTACLGCNVRKGARITT